MTLPFAGAGAPLTAAEFEAVLAKLGVEDGVLWSILRVETHGFGFLADRRPKILFERHVFSKRTGHRFDASAPDISNPIQGGYVGGAAEYGRLSHAMVLDRKAAIESASWGLGQVMGFNAGVAGYADAETMAADFAKGEGPQLAAAAAFILAKEALIAAARQKDWASFAFFYNGSGYAKDGYDIHLREAYETFSLGLKPDLKLRTSQALLLYAGYDPRGIDGLKGPGTTAALLRFQQAAGLETSGKFDAATDAALLAAAAPKPD